MYQKINLFKNFRFLRSSRKIVPPAMKRKVWQAISISHYELIEITYYLKAKFFSIQKSLIVSILL